MNFADRLKFLREEANLNQSELAKLLKISRQSISNYENGARFPNDEKLLIKIAQFFGVSVDFLLGVTNMRTFYSTPKIVCKDNNVKEHSHFYTVSKNTALENLYNEINDLPTDVIEKIIATIRLFKNK